MTEIKTAQAWGWLLGGKLFAGWRDSQESDKPTNVPVTIVHGAPESDIIAGLDLLKKSREVCEFTETGFDLGGAIFGYLACSPDENNVLTKFCPSCGRAVKITEGE